MRLNPNLKDIVVIAVKTSNIRENIDIDPETYNPLNQQRNVKLWCKHKGDIKFKYIFPYVYAHFDILSKDSNLMNQIIQNNKEKLQASQSLINSLAKN